MKKLLGLAFSKIYFF